MKSEFIVRVPERDINFRLKKQHLILPAHMDEDGRLRWPAFGGKLMAERYARDYVRSIGGRL